MKEGERGERQESAWLNTEVMWEPCRSSPSYPTYGSLGMSLGGLCRSTPVHGNRNRKARSVLAWLVDSTHRVTHVFGLHVVLLERVVNLPVGGG